MKTKLTSFLMIVFMLVAFAAIVQAAPAGKVTNLEGRADLTMPGKPARALSIGDAVSVGDIIRTKSGSKLEVTWIDGGIIRLSENSRLKVTEYTLGKTTRTTILSLFRGKVQNVVTATAKLFGQQDGSKYEVHTPTSVCGVRGTIFFAYHENGVSGVLFTQGQGFMYSKGQPGNVKPVAPGILMIVTSANKPPEAKPAKPGDANKLFNATNPSEKKKDDKKSEDDKGQGGGGAAGAGGGTSASGSGDTGGTTGEPMLGGDPTATLGTAPPGTTGTPMTNPTQGPQVVVPVDEQRPTSPSVSMVTGTVSPTQNTAATFTLSSDAKTPVTFEYNLNNAGWQGIAGNTLTLSDPLVVAGNNNILFRATDANGLVTEEDKYAKKSWTFYNLNVTTDVAEPTKASTATFNLTSNTPAVTYEYQINNSGTWVPVDGNTLQVAAPALIAGNNILQIRAKDQYGNVSLPVDYNQNAWVISDMLQNVTAGNVQGVLSGVIPAINLSASGDTGIFVNPVNGAEATLFDGSTYDGYLAGIPGSWRGLFTALYKKDSNIGVLSSTDLNDAAYNGGALNAVGTLLRTEAGTTSDTATQLFQNLPLLVLQNVAIGQAFSDPVIYGPTSGDVTTDGIMGYHTSSGGILGIWGAKTLNGNYVNATGAASENVSLYHYSYDPGYADPTDHFAFGNVTVTDDLAGHTTVSGTDSLTYLDRQYLGKLSLDYRGVYYLPQGSQLENGASYAYDSVGTGIYKLDRLAWSGDWGQNRYAYHLPASLYANVYDPENQYSFMEPIAHDMGLAGGTTPFWTGKSQLKAMGYLTEEVWNEETQEYITNPVSGETVAGPLLWNSGIGAQALTGSTVGEVFIPDAEFTGVTAGVWKDGLMKGSAYAIYKTAAGQAGWLIGKDTISGLYNSDLGVWKAEGDLTPTQRIAQLPEGVMADDLEVFHDFAFGILGGTFAGGLGNIHNQSSILQTTFYGKGLYDEEGYLKQVIPLRWGVYDVQMAHANSFSGKPSGATSWSSKIGGYGPTQMNAPFFYLADITGTWLEDGTMNGQLSGTYMTPLYLGVLSGPFYGLYTEEEISGSGGWVGQSVGTYNVTQKLAHSATWGENLYVWYSGEGGLFTDAGGWLDHTGYVMGLLGGTTAPWSGSSAFKAMGLFQLYVENDSGRGTYLWSGAIQGSVPQEIAEPASAGGIYTGYSAALWRTDSYAGAIRTLYLTPPDATTGKSTAGFLAGDNMAGSIYNLVQHTYEDVEYTETYTIGLWESTGTNTLTASAPLAFGLDPEAVTLAGGSMNAKLSGTFGGAGALTNDTAWGDFTFFMNDATPLPFGVYDLKLGSGAPGGTFSGKPIGATSWDAKLGGGLNIGDGPALAVYGGYNYEYGYWLADVGGQWNAEGEITGNVTNGKYLTTTQMGTLSGPFYGLYTEMGTDETGVYGTWVGQSIGNYEGQNLTFVSDITPSLRYYNDSGWQYESMSIYGLLGGAGPLWGSSASSPVTISAMGQLSLYGTPGSASHIFNATTYSHNYKDSTATTYDGGSYYLLYGGRELNGQMDVNLAGLYIKDGKAGFLIGSAGSIYAGIGMWNAEGAIYKEEKIATNIPAENLNSNLWYGSLSGNMSAYSNNLSGSIEYYTGAVRTLYDSAGTTWMKGGIWSFNLGGSHSGSIATPWTASIGGQGDLGPYYNGAFILDPGYWLADMSNGTWSENKLGADISGTYLTRHQMGTMNGNLLGTYNNTTWQAAGIGTYDNGQLLAYSADILSGNWARYDAATGLIPDETGSFSGIVGGTSGFFGGAADVNGMGTYNRNANSPLFTMTLANAYGGPETNPFHLYYGGAAHPASEGYGEWFEGKMMGFYAKWDGTKYTEFGLLSSDKLIVDGIDSGYSVDGNLYPGIGMWNMVDYEYQGRLASTKMADADAATFTVEPPSGWSPPAPIAGDLQGTMQMQTAKILEVNDAWGIWMSAMGGSYIDSIPAEWTSRTGWKETNAYGKPSYSLATVAGFYFDEDGGLWGGISGRSLNPDNMAIFTGDMIGISGNGNWQAMGIGSYEVTKTLAFSSSISGDIYKTAKGTLNINAYAMPGINTSAGVSNGVEYETVYFRADGDIGGANAKYGWQREAVHSNYNSFRISLTYYPNLMFQLLSFNNGVPSEATGPTSYFNTPPYVWPDFHTSPPTSPIITSQGFVIVNDAYPFEGSLTVNPTNKEFAKIFSQEVENFYTSIRLIPDPENPLAPTFEGIMGGYVKDDDPDKTNRTLWNATENPMGIVFMGENISFEGSAAMTAGVGSSFNNTGTTPDGGAYYGFFTNVVAADRTTHGMFHGLYISPSGEAGFLESTNITGASYASLNIWEADGDIYSIKVLDSISVSPSDLMVNIQQGAMSGSVEYGGTSGNFVSGGSIKQLSIGSGSTLSIKGYPCNGIFVNSEPGGTFNNPTGATAWQVDFTGYGTFGYPGYPGTIFADYGIWRMNVDDATSSWADNKIYAPVTGEFLAYTKQGTLTGTFIGSYSGTTSGVWGGITSGVYEKTRSTAFSSGMTGQVFSNKLTKWISGSVNVDADHYSWYSISGDPANFPEEKMYVEKTSNTAGTYTAIQYTDWGYKDDTHPITYTKTTWRYKITNGLITDQTLLETVPISYEDYLAEVVTMRSGVTEYTGLFMNDNRLQGVFAGFNNLSDNNNLWYNIANKQSTEIALAGLYDTWDDKPPSIMTAGVASFNPAVSMNPLTNSTSPIGGAYLAYLGAAFGTKNAAYDSLDGMVSGLYFNPDGGVGILYGAFTGSTLADIGYFNGSGTIDGGYQFGNGYNGLSAANFASKVVTYSNEWNYGINDVVVTGDNVKLRTITKNNAWINGSYLSPGSGVWGIAQNAFGGTKAAGLAPSAWAWEAHQLYSSLPRSDYTGVQMSSTVNGIGTGDFVGAAAIYHGNAPTDPGFTAVSAGSIKGLFDPAATTWQAVSQGAFMETKNFLAKVAAISGNAAAQEAFMNATKIPAIQVGQATLSQAPNTMVNNLSNVTMNNVGFYAYSTGVAPKIWATNSVGGSYSATPSTSGAAINNVPLSGNGLTATFNVNHWNGNTWGANVAGSGTLTNTTAGDYTGNIKFMGGAAGTIQPATGSSGSFSGTGAGIAK